ncbi:MAG: DNA double-strand break repair nuclease NurA [Anaerolineae bacterium]|nr:MAG: DNA double-strand break repair nuclease NurA [Anaerolineae bacterium]
MPLKLGPITEQVSRMTETVRPPEQDDLLVRARQLLRGVDPDELRARLERRAEASRRRVPWLAALPTGPLAGTHPAPSAPADFTVAAADGSAIPPDRHSPLQYYVINTGYAVLTYGARPDAILDSKGDLYFREDDLYIDPQGLRIPVSEGRLSLKMQVEEMGALVGAASMASRPAVALRDGSLIMWPLYSEETAVQAHFLHQFLECLDLLQRASFPVASYISYSGGQDVVNALRVWLCPPQAPDCGRCSLDDEQHALCVYLGSLRDRYLYAGLLADGARSEVFESSSAILEKYRDHRVRFFYLNVGGEIARVEAPVWVVDDEDMLNLLHAAVVDQCWRSGNYPPYPPALMEAHEQAVITSAERRLVEEMVERAMAERGHTYLRSAKDRSKRTRAV